jgi:hypothetical protein
VLRNCVAVGSARSGEGVVEKRFRCRVQSDWIFGLTKKIKVRHCFWMAIEKPLNEITESDLIALKTAVVREGKTVEYKRQITIDNDDRKRKFVALVASFANASGGDIIFGIQAEEGVPKEIVALSNFEPDRDIRTLRDLARAHIEPPVFGVEFKEVSVADGMALIVRIPRGWGGAHMVKFGDHRFYTRDANGRVLMSVPEIRSSFLQSEAVSERFGDLGLNG